MKKITGSQVALITPMLADGSVDYRSLQKLVEFHIESNTQAIISVGTTGESPTLTHQEHIDVIAKTVEFARARLPVIGGTGSNSTQEAIDYTQAAKDVGAAAVLLVTPYYNKPTQAGLYEHYKAIAQAVDIPQLIYNVPSRTAVDILPETVAELSKIDNIVGIKDATGDLDVAKQLLAQCVSDFWFYSGDDLTSVDFILLGGDGAISVTANVLPKELQAVCELALAHNSAAAKAADAKLRPLHKALFLEANPIPVKFALYKMGLCENHIRLPLMQPSLQNQRVIEQVLADVGVYQ